MSYESGMIGFFKLVIIGGQVDKNPFRCIFILINEERTPLTSGFDAGTESKGVESRAKTFFSEKSLHGKEVLENGNC